MRKLCRGRENTQPLNFSPSSLSSWSMFKDGRRTALYCGPARPGRAKIARHSIAVINGIVLVSYITQLRDEGRPLREAILQGCANRLRPVLMTATINDIQPGAASLRPGPGVGDPEAARCRCRRRARHLHPEDPSRSARAVWIYRKNNEGCPE